MRYKLEYELDLSKEDSDVVLKSTNGKILVDVQVFEKDTNIKNYPYAIEEMGTSTLQNLVKHQFRVYDSFNEQSISILDSNDFILMDNEGKSIPFRLHKTTKRIRQGDYIVLTLDFSESMDGLPKIKSMLAAENYLSNMSRNPKVKDVEVAGVGFTNETRLLTDFSKNYTDIAYSFYLDMTGGTALYDAIVASCNMLSRKKGRKNLILMTDGADTNSMLTIEDAIDAANKNNISINIVCLGGSVNPHTITELTSKTKGKAYYTYDANKLAEIYKEISEKEDTIYTIEYRPSHIGNPTFTTMAMTGKRSDKIEWRFDIDTTDIIASIKKALWGDKE